MNFGGKIIYETLSDIVAGRRLIAQRGGTRSGKTYSILLCLSVLACKRCVAIDIVSESLPHLKRGAIHDFDEILQRENLPVDINKQNIHLSEWVCRSFFFGRRLGKSQRFAP